MDCCAPADFTGVPEGLSSLPMCYNLQTQFKYENFVKMQWLFLKLFLPDAFNKRTKVHMIGNILIRV